MLNIGDKVRLKRGARFYYNQGCVSFGEIGKIIEINEEDYVNKGHRIRINFPSHSTWQGYEEEVEKVEEINMEDLVCRDCGEKIEGEYHEIDGEYLCDNCFEENYSYCDDCGEIISRDNGYYVESEDRFVCEDCLDGNYFKCEDCGEYFTIGSGYEINDRGDTYLVCESCYSGGNYFCCEECGNYYTTEEMNEHGYSYYCDDCYDELGGALYDYHEFNDWEFFKGKEEKEPPYYIGAEIELEPLDYSNVSGMIDTINNNINAVGMRDSSLREGGVEVVTHPESYQYKLEHKDNYVNFFKGVERLKYGDYGGAGLHFHVSRPNDNVVSRVMVLLESFKDEIKKLSRRNGDTHWAAFLSDTTSDELQKQKYQSSKYLKDEYIKGRHDRYFALNLCNENTIEFRFFNGANNFEEFWGALQFIHNIMELALDEDRELKTINWNDLINGDELVEQAKKQGVYGIDKFAKDTTEILEKLLETEEKIKKEIKRILSNLIRYVNKEMAGLDIKTIKSRDIEEINSKSEDFLSQFRYRMQYLSNVIGLYRTIDNKNIDDIKECMNILKINYPVNSDRYSRYGKQIDKEIKKYKEMM